MLGTYSLTRPGPKVPQQAASIKAAAGCRSPGTSPNGGFIFITLFDVEDLVDSPLAQVRQLRCSDFQRPHCQLADSAFVHVDGESVAMQPRSFAAIAERQILFRE